MTLTLIPPAIAAVSPKAKDLNPYVLQAIQNMPAAGGYSTAHEAGEALVRAVVSRPELSVDAQNATPSFCTSATYLVFLNALELAAAQGEFSLGNQATAVYDKLLPPSDITSLFKDDGKGLWGRWNANGPGTGRFFYETGIGGNFTSAATRKPGDFLKIWWTEAVGAKERGHSVVYLGARKNPTTGDPELQYWSSNQGTGYNKVWVSESKVIHAIYSRLTAPQNLTRALSIPETGTYLRDCLTVESSFAEAKQKSGI